MMPAELEPVKFYAFTLFDGWLYELIRRAAQEKRYKQANQIYRLLGSMRIARVTTYSSIGAA